MSGFSVGDVVKYSRQWLRSTGQFTGPVPFAVGVITDLQTLGRSGPVIACIKWRDVSLPDRVLTSNLVRADRVHLEIT
jgi:hypothetical protein